MLHKKTIVSRTVIALLCTHMIIQSSTDPCPAYPVSSYKFHVTEWYTNRLVSNTTRTSELDMFILDGSNGLTRDQIYSLVIEAVNSVGGTFSEEIQLCN